MTGKEKAIEILKQIDVHEPYIEGLREEDKVCFFENVGGFWIDQEPEAYRKMQKIEQKHGCKVYAVTHEYTEFGECWDYLIVTAYPEKWDELYTVVKENRQSTTCKDLQPTITKTANFSPIR